MTRTFTIVTLFAAAALAGCNEGSHTIVAGPNTEDEAGASLNNANVELPPAIAASKIYRCKDNSVVYIDWLADNKTANFRANQSDTPVQLRGTEPGQAMVAEGYSLTGSATAATVTLARPGKGSQTCKA